MRISEYFQSIFGLKLIHHIDDFQKVFSQEMRNSYRALIPSAGLPDPVGSVEQIQIPSDESTRAIPARLYRPLDTDSSKKLPMVLFIHGGGFVSGDLDTHDVLVRAICNGVRAIVVSVDYRLAPEFPFPSGLEDSYTALQWMSREAETFNGDNKRIAVAGDSAGANFAAIMAILAREIGDVKLVAQWLMYPTTLDKTNTESWVKFGDIYFPTKAVMSGVKKSYIPEGILPSHPFLAPLLGNLKYLPPALLQVGGLDPLQDENILYSEALKKAGVDAQVFVYENQQHGFIQFYKDKVQHPKGEEALKVGLEFLNNHLNKK